MDDGQLLLFEAPPPALAPPARRSREEVVNDYDGFVAKFEPKLTTDDCYTPQHVYDAVADWVADEYGVARERFVRPFWPGGDFERYEYPDGSVVVDNPPFSILAKIVRWYLARGIRFFLFAPALTLLNTNGPVCAVGAGCEIKYENGAVVRTSFLTDLDEHRARTAPGLYAAVEAAQRRDAPPSLPKYTYPPNVLLSTHLVNMSKAGVDFRVPREEASFTRALDAQRPVGKAIFGAGLLISDRLAAERLAAERPAAERLAGDGIIEWELSARERRIVEGMAGLKGQRR